mgnify:CR=1 FL=1
MIPLTIQRTIANTIPDIQLLISNPLTSCAVRRIIKNPITALTRPKVKKFIGKVRILSNAHTVAFTRPRTTATIRAVTNQVIVTHGVIYQATSTAIPDIRRLTINDMILRNYDIKVIIYKALK